jgi:hypothetical protein
VMSGMERRSVASVSFVMSVGSLLKFLNEKSPQCSPEHRGRLDHQPKRG